MLKRFAAALTGLLISSVVAFAGQVPLLPSSPNYSDPSQIQPTINSLVQMLNGQSSYATAPATISIGTQCANAAAGASPQVCNGQRGAVAFTGITPTTTGTTQTLVITNSAVTAASYCTVNPTTAFTAGSAMTVATVVPSAGSLSIVIVNAGTTANAVTTGTLGFNCFN